MPRQIDTSSHLIFYKQLYEKTAISSQNFLFREVEIHGSPVIVEWMLECDDLNAGVPDQLPEISFFQGKRVLPSPKLQNEGNTLIFDFRQEKVKVSKIFGVKIKNTADQRVQSSLTVYYSSDYYSARHRCARPKEAMNFRW